MTTHDRIIHSLRTLSPDGIHGPTLYEWRSARKQDKAAYPREEIVRAIFGGWRQSVIAAGLTPSTTRRKGDTAKHRNQAEVDAVLAEEFPGWMPGNESAHYLRAALLGEGGLTVAKAVEEVRVEIFDIQGRPLLRQDQAYFNPAHYPEPFIVHIQTQQRCFLR